MKPGLAVSVDAVVVLGVAAGACVLPDGAAGSSASAAPRNRMAAAVIMRDRFNMRFSRFEGSKFSRRKNASAARDVPSITPASGGREPQNDFKSRICAHNAVVQHIWRTAQSVARPSGCFLGVRNVNAAEKG